MTKTPILTAILTAILGGSLLVAALAGCTSTTSATPTKTPTSSASDNSGQTAEQSARLKQQTEANGKCIDGIAYIGASKTTVKLDEACATVYVRGVAATVSLGDVVNLVIENNGNTITAKSVKSIANISNGNKVTYGGAKAEVHDNGQNNSFTNK